MPLQEKRRNSLLPPAEFVRQVTGNQTVGHAGIAEIARLLDPRTQRERDEIAQGIELYFINHSADQIEAAFAKQGLPSPTVFTVLTGRLQPPEGSVSLGAYGEDGAFRLFPQADISGHLGEGFAHRLTKKRSELYLAGRAHPFSGVGKEYAEFFYARPFSVMKELMRRNRERGLQSMVILTYLTGVAENSPIKPGDLAIVADYTEQAGGRAGLSAGSGPRFLLDAQTGERFEAKMGRGSDKKLARYFLEMATAAGVNVGAAASVGTPDTTSYQGFLNIGSVQVMYEKAKLMGLDAFVAEMFDGDVSLSLFYNMAQPFEADSLRQVIRRERPLKRKKTIFDEADFPLLILVLPTDSVGEGSRKIDHGKVIAQAEASAPRNSVLIAEFVRIIGPRLNQLYPIQEVPRWVGALSLSRTLPRV